MNYFNISKKQAILSIIVRTILFICKKKKEIYNGVEKVWFYLEGVDSDNYSTSYSILPSGAFYTGASRWQYLATDSPKGWIH